MGLSDPTLIANLRKEFRAGNASQSLGLLDPRGGSAQVVVILQCFFNQALERVVLKDRPPWQIGQGGRLGRVDLPAVGLRYNQRGALVIRANGTAGEKRHDKD